MAAAGGRSRLVLGSPRAVSAATCWPASEEGRRSHENFGSRRAFRLHRADGNGSRPTGRVPLKEGHVDYLDTDNNNAVQPGELQVFVGQAFVHLDTNKDGSLVSAETAAILTAAQFSAVDENGNGRISQAELMKQMSEDFAAADRDKDGQLD